MKIVFFLLKFRWSLLIKDSLLTSQHWFQSCLHQTGDDPSSKPMSLTRQTYGNMTTDTCLRYLILIFFCVTGGVGWWIRLSRKHRRMFCHTKPLWSQLTVPGHRRFLRMFVSERLSIRCQWHMPRYSSALLISTSAQYSRCNYSRIL